MADLPETLSFKSSTWMALRLRRMAADNRRKLGDMIRILLEQKLLEEENKDGKV